MANEPNFFQKLINRPLPAVSALPERTQPRGMPTAAAAKDKKEKDAAPQAATPIYITKESIITFGGATAAAYGVWTVLSLLIGHRASEVIWLGYLVSLILSVFIWWQAVADPRVNAPVSPTPLSDYDKKVALGLAVLNSFQIFLAALGSIKATGL
jgi:hypothetical protein